MGILVGRLVRSSESPKTDKFLWNLLLFVLTYLLIALIWFIIETVNARVLPDLENTVRNEILSYVLDQDQSPYNSFAKGETMANLSRIPHLVYMQMISISFYIMPLFFTLLFLFLYFFRFGKKLAFVFLIFVLILSGVFWVWFQRLLYLSSDRYKTELNLSEKFDDTLANSENIINENLTQETMVDIKREENLYAKSLEKELFSINLWKQSLVASFVLLFGFLVYIAYGDWKINQLTLPLFISFVTMIVFVISKIISLVNRTGDLSYIMGGTTVSNQSFQTLSPSSVPTSMENFSLESPTIEIKNLSFSYMDSMVSILEDINWSLDFPSNHLIKGPSGSGKTTLCRCLMRYFDLPPNTLLINGISIEKIPRNILREYFSIMTQNGFLFHDTGRNNISKDPKVWKDLNTLSIYPKIQPLLNRDVGKMGTALSGGERQILLLLRAYYRKSSLLILDEPTSNMDFKSREIILEIIRHLCENKTVICITHDDEMNDLFENHYLLENGSFQKIK